MLVLDSLKAPVHSPAKHEGTGWGMRAFFTSPAVLDVFFGCSGGRVGRDGPFATESQPHHVPDTLASGGSRAVPTGLPLGRMSAGREGQTPNQ